MQTKPTEAPDWAIKRAKQLARESSQCEAVVWIDGGASFVVHVISEAYTATAEFEAFDGEILAIVSPDDSVI